MNKETLDKLREKQNNIPPEAEGTQSYILAMVNLLTQELDTVPDFAAGGDRRPKRWAATFNIAATNKFDTTAGSIYQVQPNTLLIDGDTKEALRARLIHEIDCALELAELTNQEEETRSVKGPQRIVQ